jgi:CelD/BcsL family acetyltransferase involved in cellulose biosynthesis
MRIRVVPARELDTNLTERWAQLQEADPQLASPYFCPEFTQAAAAVQDGVRVAVMERVESVVGFFPFQRARMGVGRPVGGRLSDYQGVVAARDAEWDAEKLIRGCELSIWDFDHLLASQEPFRAFHQVVASSPVMDLSRGFEAYVQERRASGTNRIIQIMRKRRKLEREVGPLRFESHVSDASVLDEVIRWKSAQCRSTGAFDFFQLDWTVELVRRIHQTQTDRFGGVLSALYAGDRLAAAHMGMRSRSVCHWWFPGYAHDLAAYSPGSILLLELARWAADHGLTTLDLGKGDDAYKQSFLSSNVPVAEGSVIRPSLAGVNRRLRNATDSFLRRSPLAAPVRLSLRLQRRIRRKLGARSLGRPSP